MLNKAESAERTEPLGGGGGGGGGQGREEGVRVEVCGGVPVKSL